MCKLYTGIIVTTLIGLIAVIYGQISYAVISSDLIYLKDSKPYGIPFSEWMGKWWQWHVSLPNKINDSDPTNLKLAHPREAYSPEKCAWNQNNNNIWFLPDGRNLALNDAQTPELRKCTVPHDKALLVQIYGGGCSYAEGLKTDQELRDCVNIGLDTVKFTAKVDGIQVMSSDNRNDFLPVPYLYNLTFVKDNLYDAPYGTYRAMADGYFLFVKPLSVGNHTIEFKETFFKPGFEGQPSSENRISNVAYDLTVK
jgi:hypothetical protein